MNCINDLAFHSMIIPCVNSWIQELKPVEKAAEPVKEETKIPAEAEASQDGIRHTWPVTWLQTNPLTLEWLLPLILTRVKSWFIGPSSFCLCLFYLHKTLCITLYKFWFLQLKIRESIGRQAWCNIRSRVIEVNRQLGSVKSRV